MGPNEYFWSVWFALIVVIIVLGVK